jgi:hypothetical protein
MIITVFNNVALSHSWPEFLKDRTKSLLFEGESDYGMVRL